MGLAIERLEAPDQPGFLPSSPVYTLTTVCLTTVGVHLQRFTVCQHVTVRLTGWLVPVTVTLP